jgi:hypothetical protein
MRMAGFWVVLRVLLGFGIDFSEAFLGAAGLKSVVLLHGSLYTQSYIIVHNAL